MKYNGIELVEMTPEKWDGKLRTMLVWNCASDTPIPVRIVEWYKNRLGHVIWRDVYCKYWDYCAEEIPKDEPAEEPNIYIEKLKAENEELKTKVDELKNSASYRIHCTLCNEKNKT